MHFTKIVLTASLLTLMLAACNAYPFPQFSDFYVVNESAPNNGSVDVYEVCEGGLRSTLKLPGLTLDSKTVSPGASYQQDGRNNAVNGDTFEVEAWCFDETGLETGYIRATGVVKGINKGTNLIYVSGQLIEGLGYDHLSCVQTETVRGSPPCIQESPAFVVQ